MLTAHKASRSFPSITYEQAIFPKEAASRWSWIKEKVPSFCVLGRNGRSPIRFVVVVVVVTGFVAVAGPNDENDDSKAVDIAGCLFVNTIRQ